MPERQIPPDRKGVFYAGTVVIVVGFVLFFSTFFSIAAGFSNMSHIEDRFGSMAMRSIIGFIMIVVGGMMTKVGRMGLAGSGIKLDPEEARREVEPWARMAGGVAKDAIDEAGIKLGGHSTGEDLSFDEKLRRLRQLRDDQIINEQEYETAKKKILESA